jgi:hypothetical protein
MRFDPQVVQPDDNFPEHGNLEFPAHLAELAAQLTDDAQHLASVYPAKSVEALPLVESRRRPRYLLRAVAIAVSLAAGLCTGNLLWPGKVADHGRLKVPAIEVAQGPSVDASVEAESDQNTTNDSPLEPNRRVGPPAAASPAMFLHEYSGPELEGLYDLLGDEDNKISI